MQSKNYRQDRDGIIISAVLKGWDMRNSMKTLWKTICLAVFFGLLVGIPPQNLASQTAVDTRFGAIESFWAPNEAAALGVGWERILFYWSEIEPTGPTDWNTLHVLEEWLAEANAQGRTIVGLLKNTPPWATDGEPYSGVPRGLYLPINDPGNLWATYTREVAQYYGPRGVHHWIIWNEPDIDPGVYGHEFSGTVEDYYQLVKVAYQSIKAVDPNAVIHLGGLTYWHDQGYLRRFLQVVTADPEAPLNNYFFDVITLHIYFRVETVQSIVGAAWAVQSEFGLNKAVWVNETNAAPNLDPLWPVDRPQFQIDLAQQAWYVPQAFALGFSAGAARIGIYKLIDVQLPPGGESFGILRPDFSQRPAYFAYQNTIRLLSGFSYPVQKQQMANYFIVSFPKPGGMVRVMWARTAVPVTLDVPALTTSAQLVTALGETTSLTAVNGVYRINLEGAVCQGECLVGGPPLFLVEEGVTVTSVPTVAAGQAVATLASSPTPTATAVPPTATATATKTPTPHPTQTATPTAEPSATQTAVPSSTATVSATPKATEITAVLPTATPIPPPPPAAPPAQTSWWFIGAGVGLGIILLLWAWKQR